MELTVKQEARRPGRPKVEGGRMRQKPLQIRLSDEEHSALIRRANLQDTTVTGLVRGIITNITNAKETDIVVDVAGGTFAVSKEEAKQILKSITDQLLS